MLVRTLTIAMAVAASPVVLHAQDFDLKSATHVKVTYMNDLDTLHNKILQLANAIPADKYSWKPAPGTRSVAEALMHVANEFYYYTPASVGGTPPADFGVPKDAMAKNEKISAKADVIAQLEKSWAHTKAQVAAADPAKMGGKFGRWNVTIDEAAFAMTDDLHEHLGQLIVYARSVGVTPPWSK